MEDIVRIYRNIVSLVNETLPVIDNILTTLRSCKQLFASTPVTVTVLSTNDKLRQIVKEVLLMLKAEFLASCKSLATYGSDRETHRGILDEVSHGKVLRLQRFFDTCSKRINAVVEYFDIFNQTIITLRVEIKNAAQFIGEKQGINSSRIFWSNLGFGVGGIVTVVGAIATVTVPPIGIVGIAVGAVASGTGYYTHQYYQDNVAKEEMAILKEAQSELKQLLEVINKVYNHTIGCCGKIRSAVDRLSTRKYILKVEEKTTAGSQYANSAMLDDLKNYKCFSFDEAQLEHHLDSSDVESVLEEFAECMESLLEKTNNAITNVDEYLNFLQ